MLHLSERPNPAAEQPEGRPPRRAFLRTLQAASARRALLLTALGGLLIAGVVTALPIGDQRGLSSEPLAGVGSKANSAFANAKSGSCLNWPDKSPDAAAIVDCKDEHRFEVAESVDMRTFPGSEYGPDAPPPSAARIQQISVEQCQPAVKRYLADKFDPNSKFSISMLWAGDKAWKQSGERRMLCGLQLPGPDNQQLAFKGRVADIDQSKVWPAGTCLGIDPSTNQPTDVPVDCSAPHAMEVTGAVNLAEKFPGALPAEVDQDAFIKDACTRMTDAFLAPVQLRDTTLTLIYSTISLPTWTAGSHQVSCSIGATLGNGGWATLINSAKGPLLINGQTPVPPPDIPEERLNLPPIPTGPASPGTAYSPSTGGTSQSGSQYGSQSGSQSGSQTGSQSGSAQQDTQHLPQQQAPGPAQAPPPPPPPPPAPAPAPAGDGAQAPAGDAPPAEAPPAEAPPGPPPGPAEPVPPPA